MELLNSMAIYVIFVVIPALHLSKRILVEPYYQKYNTKRYNGCNNLAERFISQKYRPTKITLIEKENYLCRIPTIQIGNGLEYTIRV